MPPKVRVKNKRGERGSTDDETTEPKRANMATSDFDLQDTEEQEEDEQPALSDIHGLLKDLIKSVNNLSKEVVDLKSSFKQQETELRKAKEALNTALKYNDQLKIELRATKERLNDREDEIDELYEKVDALEQYTRKNSLEIVGIPENVCDDEEVVLKIARALNVEVKPEDIDICHRIKRKKSNPIIARFVSHQVKKSLYKQRVQLKNITCSQLFPDASTTARVSFNKIFINENLTAHRRNLVRLANKKKEDGLLISAWTVDGKVFVKTSPEGRPIRINIEDDLDNL